MRLNWYENRIFRVTVVLEERTSMDLGGETLSAVVNGITLKKGGIIFCAWTSMWFCAFFPLFGRY